ncbi:MAG TPA: AMP-binding protein, partial [Gammaproteobacteria bacterium]|nr:AMP-binding protein [Gammaproteobacteria bacterium]
IYERIYNTVHGALVHRPVPARKLFALAVSIGWKRFLYRQGRGHWSPGLAAWPALERLVARRLMARLGGRLRIAVCGGAPLPPTAARLFLSLGLPLVQGYGLTETGPVLSGNRPEDNDPASVGRPLPDVQIRVGADGELLVKSPGVMQGYWRDPAATAGAFDAGGWLHTGDRVRLAEGRIYITGRLKEIIVLANGEKVPPADMEMAITADPLFEQVMVLGDERPYLSALVVLNPEQWPPLARGLGLDPADPASLSAGSLHRAVLRRIDRCLEPFPGHVRIRRVACSLKPWTIHEGLLTPTLKLRRQRLMERHRSVIDWLYAGH